MSPRTGRPPKGEAKKNERIEVRVDSKKAEQLRRCAEIMNTSRAQVIEYGIDLVEAELQKKK